MTSATALLNATRAKADDLTYRHDIAADDAAKRKQAKLEVLHRSTATFIRTAIPALCKTVSDQNDALSTVDELHSHTSAELDKHKKRSVRAIAGLDTLIRALDKNILHVKRSRENVELISTLTSLRQNAIQVKAALMTDIRR